MGTDAILIFSTLIALTAEALPAVQRIMPSPLHPNHRPASLFPQPHRKLSRPWLVKMQEELWKDGPSGDGPEEEQAWSTLLHPSRGTLASESAAYETRSPSAGDFFSEPFPTVIDTMTDESSSYEAEMVGRTSVPYEGPSSLLNSLIFRPSTPRDDSSQGSLRTPDLEDSRTGFDSFPDESFDWLTSPRQAVSEAMTDNFVIITAISATHISELDPSFNVTPQTVQQEIHPSLTKRESERTIQTITNFDNLPASLNTQTLPFLSEGKLFNSVLTSLRSFTKSSGDFHQTSTSHLHSDSRSIPSNLLRTNFYSNAFSETSDMPYISSNKLSSSFDRTSSFDLLANLSGEDVKTNLRSHRVHTIHSNFFYEFNVSDFYTTTPPMSFSHNDVLSTLTVVENDWKTFTPTLMVHGPTSTADVHTMDFRETASAKPSHISSSFADIRDSIPVISLWPIEDVSPIENLISRSETRTYVEERSYFIESQDSHPLDQKTSHRIFASDTILQGDNEITKPKSSFQVVPTKLKSGIPLVEPTKEKNDIDSGLVVETPVSRKTSQLISGTESWMNEMEINKYGRKSEDLSTTFYDHQKSSRVIESFMFSTPITYLATSSSVDKEQSVIELLSTADSTSVTVIYQSEKDMTPTMTSVLEIMSTNDSKQILQTGLDSITDFIDHSTHHVTVRSLSDDMATYDSESMLFKHASTTRDDDLSKIVSSRVLSSDISQSDISEYMKEEKSFPKEIPASEYLSTTKETIFHEYENVSNTVPGSVEKDILSSYPRYDVIDSTSSSWHSLQTNTVLSSWDKDAFTTPSLPIKYHSTRSFQAVSSGHTNRESQSNDINNTLLTEIKDTTDEGYLTYTSRAIIPDTTHYFQNESPTNSFYDVKKYESVTHTDIFDSNIATIDDMFDSRHFSSLVTSNHMDIRPSKTFPQLQESSVVEASDEQPYRSVGISDDEHLKASEGIRDEMQIQSSMVFEYFSDTEVSPTAFPYPFSNGLTAISHPTETKLLSDSILSPKDHMTEQLIRSSHGIDVTAIETHYISDSGTRIMPWHISKLIENTGIYQSINIFSRDSSFSFPHELGTSSDIETNGLPTVSPSDLSEHFIFQNTSTVLTDFENYSRIHSKSLSYYPVTVFSASSDFSSLNFDKSISFGVSPILPTPFFTSSFVSEKSSLVTFSTTYEDEISSQLSPITQENGLFDSEFPQISTSVQSELHLEIPESTQSWFHESSNVFGDLFRNTSRQLDGFSFLTVSSFSEIPHTSISELASDGESEFHLHPEEETISQPLLTSEVYSADGDPQSNVYSSYLSVFTPVFVSESSTAFKRPMVEQTPSKAATTYLKSKLPLDSESLYMRDTSYTYSVSDIGSSSPVTIPSYEVSAWSRSAKPDSGFLSNIDSSHGVISSIMTEAMFVTHQQTPELTPRPPATAWDVSSCEMTSCIVSSVVTQNLDSNPVSPTFELSSEQQEIKVSSYVFFPDSSIQPDAKIRESEDLKRGSKLESMKSEFPFQKPNGMESEHPHKATGSIFTKQLDPKSIESDYPLKATIGVYSTTKLEPKSIDSDYPHKEKTEVYSTTKLEPKSIQSELPHKATTELYSTKNLEPKSIDSNYPLKATTELYSTKTLDTKSIDSDPPHTTTIALSTAKPEPKSIDSDLPSLKLYSTSRKLEDSIQMTKPIIASSFSGSFHPQLDTSLHYHTLIISRSVSKDTSASSPGSAAELTPRWPSEVSTPGFEVEMASVLAISSFFGVNGSRNASSELDKNGHLETNWSRSEVKPTPAMDLRLFKDNNYWILTVLEAPIKGQLPENFSQILEQRLANAYSEVFQTKPSKPTDAKTTEPIIVKILSMRNDILLSQLDIVYVVEKGGVLVPAITASEFLNFLRHEQLREFLGLYAILKAKPYRPEETAKPEPMSSTVPVVTIVCSIIGVLLFVFCCFCIYCKCFRPKQADDERTPTSSASGSLQRSLAKHGQHNRKHLFQEMTHRLTTEMASHTKQELPASDPYPIEKEPLPPGKKLPPLPSSEHAEALDKAMKMLKILGSKEASASPIVGKHSRERKKKRKDAEQDSAKKSKKRKEPKESAKEKAARETSNVGVEEDLRPLPLLPKGEDHVPETSGTPPDSGTSSRHTTSTPTSTSEKTIEEMGSDGSNAELLPPLQDLIAKSKADSAAATADTQVHLSRVRQRISELLDDAFALANGRKFYGSMRGKRIDPATEMFPRYSSLRSQSAAECSKTRLEAESPIEEKQRPISEGAQHLLGALTDDGQLITRPPPKLVWDHEGMEESSPIRHPEVTEAHNRHVNFFPFHQQSKARQQPMASTLMPALDTLQESDTQLTTAAESTINVLREGSTSDAYFAHSSKIHPAAADQYDEIDVVNALREGEPVADLIQAIKDELQKFGASDESHA